MDSRTRPCCTVLCIMLTAAGTLSAAGDRPNIVIFLLDDLGRQDVGFMGGTAIRTPQIDRLAAAGARLDNFYVQPLCSPTRAALMTGRYPMRYGLQVGVVRPWAQHGLPLAERTLPQALAEAGYTTAIIGKWHLGHFERAYLPTRRGFHYQYGHYNGALDYFTHLRDGGLDWHRNDDASRDEGYATHLLAREASRVIRETPAGKPLFLYVPFNAVHAPYQVPASYASPYADLPEPRRTYAGMLAAADEAIGQIVAALNERGLAENTLILFASDNGGPSPGQVTDNGPLRAGKGTLYEGGVRVCAFATWPGRIPPGITVRQPMHIVDWCPTLLGIASAALRQDLPVDGLDVWPVISRAEPMPRRTILINTTPWNGAIRVDDWKLVLNGHVNDMQRAENPSPPRGRENQASGETRVELFDLSRDPGEKVNLATVFPNKVKELRARLAVRAREAAKPNAGPRPAGFKIPQVWGEP